MAGGAPLKLTPALTAALVETLTISPYIGPAAALVGVDASTVRKWLARGRREQAGPYHEFFLTIQKARAAAELDMVRDLRTTPDQWQRYAWLLERAFPLRWGRRDRVEVALYEGAVRKATELGLDPDLLLAETQAVLAERIGQ